MSRDTEQWNAPGIRVLIVDDTAGIRLLLRMLLEEAGGFDILGEAADGSEAIEQAGKLRPDMVLLDMAMPVLDGLQALPEILKRSPSSKVVVFSGFMADKLAPSAMALGATAYIEKGTLPEKLVSQLIDIAAVESSTASVNVTDFDADLPVINQL